MAKVLVNEGPREASPDRHAARNRRQLTIDRCCPAFRAFGSENNPVNQLSQVWPEHFDNLENSGQFLTSLGARTVPETPSNDPATSDIARILAGSVGAGNSRQPVFLNPKRP